MVVKDQTSRRRVCMRSTSHNGQEICIDQYPLSPRRGACSLTNEIVAWYAAQAPRLVHTLSYN